MGGLIRGTVPAPYSDAMAASMSSLAARRAAKLNMLAAIASE